jgi:glutaminase
LEKLKSLQIYGAKLSATDYDGRTPLHVAASYGQLPIVEFLPSQDASVHIKDQYENTPLIAAVLADQVVNQ